MLSPMKRTLILMVALTLLLSAVAPAQSESVALGVGGGTAARGPDAAGLTDFAFAWGFYVNIPILPTFHITPSSELYQIDGTYATDVALGFRFAVPMGSTGLYFGVSPGLTASGTETSPHVGALGGVTFPLISNIRGFAQYKYNVLFRGQSNIRYSHLTAGLLFAF